MKNDDVPFYKFKIGETVRVLALPESILKGLPSEEIYFFNNKWDKLGVVDSFADGDKVVLEIIDLNDGSYHYVWIDYNLIEPTG